MGKFILIFSSLIFLSFGCVRIPTYDYNNFMQQIAETNPQQAKYKFFSPDFKRDFVTPFKRMIVKSIDEESDAAVSGIQKGDEILTVNGESFKTIEGFQDFLKKAVWIEKKFFIHRKTENTEKEITLIPKSKNQNSDIVLFQNGIYFGFLDKENKMINPLLLKNEYLIQEFEVGRFYAAASVSERYISITYGIRNLSDEKINFNPQDIALLDSDRQVLHSISNESANVSIPSKAIYTGRVYFFNNGVSPPINLKLSFLGKEINFKFK